MFTSISTTTLKFERLPMRICWRSVLGSWLAQKAMMFRREYQKSLARWRSRDGIGRRYAAHPNPSDAGPMIFHSRPALAWNRILGQGHTLSRSSA